MPDATTRSVAFAFVSAPSRPLLPPRAIFAEPGRVERGAPDQRAVDVGLGEERPRRCPPSRSRRRGCASPASSSRGLREQAADPRVHLLRVLGPRDLARADCPDRLVSDGAEARLLAELRDEGAHLPLDHLERVARLALGERLADADDGAQSGAIAAAVFFATISSVSPKSCRRSLCPRMTQVAPASLSMPAAISPVNAPEASACMFWAAMVTRLFPSSSSCATAASAVNGAADDHIDALRSRAARATAAARGQRPARLRSSSSCLRSEGRRVGLKDPSGGILQGGGSRRQACLGSPPEGVRDSNALGARPRCAPESMSRGTFTPAGGDPRRAGLFQGAPRLPMPGPFG